MLSALKEKLVSWDHTVWYYMNTQWHNSFLDAVVPFFRNQYFWTPLYLFLLLYMTSRFKMKGWIWCVAFLISFIISDQLSATLLKPYFHRLRPCQNPALADMIHLVVNCGGRFGFPSSHAANHFSIGVFMAMTLSKRVKWIWTAAIAWAVLVSFSQVYVGVHYPLDVTFGGLIGATIGICTGTIFNRYFDLTALAATGKAT
jgi:membrane-associated phospholipid phosphatase